MQNERSNRRKVIKTQEPVKKIQIIKSSSKAESAMNKERYIACIDVGGSHISAALVAEESGDIVAKSCFPVNSLAERSVILETWTTCISEV